MPDVATETALTPESTTTSATPDARRENAGSTRAALDATITRQAEALFDDLVDIRRDLHAHPETARNEHRTTRRISEVLRAAGLEPRVLPVGTGLLCDVVPTDPVAAARPWIGLRADIDALPITDGKHVEYRSQNPGVCHACGHDVHTTVVLGVGRVLAALRDAGTLPRPVRLIFQPAEEASPCGSLDAIAGGALTDLTEVYAVHCDPKLEVGTIGLKVGPITAACDRILVRVSGTGGHTSRPHLTADVVGALSLVATSTPLLLSRRIDPRVGASLIWGRIQAGSACNAIPSEGEIEGTMRALQVDGWKIAEDMLPEIVTELATPFGVKVDVEMVPGIPPTVNHAVGIERLTDAAGRLLAPGAVLPTEQSLGGEDFAWMLQRVPGALARLGVRERGVEGFADIHQPTFTVDEEAIAVGVRLLAGVATRTDGTDAEG
ncbi:amidohydrolase [Friedmanniella endophytica]|uniref:Amidohydrolase n=1 Tax=Microlunatus kandeliicorticis TaxID=1759536 RepID=A0A7W3IQA2_9ACTN|nr:amidohydrolase [Microlunatus kandeliicorticis]MBA8793268.1 amidohydrolase [Microlunatus kandeliicorticis]